jgi:ankyrin repeat protein
MNVTDELWEAIYAGKFKAVKEALEEGAKVNTVDDEGYTPLVLACGRGDLEMVELLIEHGAKLNHMSHGNNVLTVAAASGQRHVYEYLRPLVSAKIRATASDADLSEGEMLRARRDDPRVDEFVMAAARGKLDEIKSALEDGANPNVFNSNGQTALQYAAYYGHLPVVEALLTAGADIDIRTEEKGVGIGMTALSFIAGSGYTRGHEAIIQTLVAAGADIDAQTGQGTTPLMLAASSGVAGFPQAVKALLEAGADTELTDVYGRTALKLALDRKLDEIAVMLRKAGAKEP